MLERAFHLSKKETVEARFELAVEEQLSTIENNFSNILILIQRYMEVCQQVM